MKKKGLLMLGVMILMLSVAACTQATETEKEEVTSSEEAKKKNETSTSDVSDKEKKTQSVEKQKEEKKEAEKKDSDKIEINVYKSNANSNGFETEKTELSELTDQAVLQALIDQKVLPEDVGIVSFKIEDVDGKKSIHLDFDTGFSAYILNVGSSEEYYAMGSVCNTFLEAFDCEQIKITVYDNILETGHRDYPGYMKKYT